MPVTTMIEWREQSQHHILSTILFKSHLYCHQHAYNIIIQQQKVNNRQLQKELDDSTSVLNIYNFVFVT